MQYDVYWLSLTHTFVCIYRIVCALYNLGDVLAILTRWAKLRKKMQFREAGPTIFLKDCKLMVPWSFEHHIRIWYAPSDAYVANSDMKNVMGMSDPNVEGLV